MITEERTLQLLAANRTKDAIDRLVHREGYTYREAKQLVTLHELLEREDALEPLNLLLRIRELEREVRSLQRRTQNVRFSPGDVL